MNYRNIADLNHTILKNLHRLPHGIDIVVGIPRSGLLAASLIAIHKNLPFTDLDGHIAGRLLSAGQRLGGDGQQQMPGRVSKALVVDDSICSGSEIRNARRRLAAAGLKHEILFSAVYGLPGSADVCDIVLEICHQPRIFEWNLLNHTLLQSTCFDIDGVLCRDPTEEENDDGDRYRRFIRSAEPYLLPQAPIGYVATS